MNDTRDALGLANATVLADAGVTVRVHDPKGTAVACEQMPDLTYCGDACEAAEAAIGIVIETEWDACRALDIDRRRDLWRRLCSAICATSTAALQY